MHYAVSGPFDLPVINRCIDHSARSKKAFWRSVEDVSPGLSEACGCYLFAVKARKGTLPWYVGLTTKSNFKGEALGPHKILYYNQSIANKNGVAPQLFFIAKKTPSTNRFAKSSKNTHPDVEFLEKFLIALAVSRNSNFLNKKNTKFLKSLIVPGVLNSPKGAPSTSERKLKKILGL